LKIIIESQFTEKVSHIQNNWDVISPFFKFPEEIRKIIYTTNIIEGLHRQFRKVTKTKTHVNVNKNLGQLPE